MKTKSFKKTLFLVAGSLIIALVISILPGGFLVNAENLTRKEAKKVALEYVEDTSAKIIEIDDSKLDEDQPYYLIKIKTDKSEYVLKVDTKTATIKPESKKSLETNIFFTAGDFDNFDDFEKFIKDDDFIGQKEYTNYGTAKPTAEADLNEVLRDAKKVAIADYKTAKDNLDKEDDNYKENKATAQETFKEAKNILTDVKKEVKQEVKTEKVEDKNNKIDKDDNDELVQKTKISEKQALIIALKKIGLTIDTADVVKLDNLTKVNDYRLLFSLENLRIEADDDNPPAYELLIEVNNYKYEVTIHAISGSVLDYEREYLDQDDDKDDQDSKVNKVSNDQKINKGNNSKGNNK